MAKADTKNKEKLRDPREGYAFAMSHANPIDQPSSLMQMLPLIVFSSVVIMLVRMQTYYRPMSQFYWAAESDQTQISDFFSLFKMRAVLVIGVIALLMLLFRFTTQSFAVKKTWLYIPMGVYTLFVVLSYFLSDYKEFALYGFNDRFEGTLPILVYMLMLFMAINTVNSERNVRQIIWPLAAVSVMLSILGITQATDHDFFRTPMGQKLILPNLMLEAGGTTWQAVDEAAAKGEQFLSFTFQNREIYQTVYNINYVSFYLTLLVPLFGMLFIRAIDLGKEEKLWKKIVLGVILALIVFNLIGSASSGGYLGIGVMGILAVILFNKRLLKWWKPLVMVFVLAGVVMAFTADRWYPELTGAVKTSLGIYDAPAVEEQAESDENAPASKKPYIDYFNTGVEAIDVMVNGNLMHIISTSDENGEFQGITVTDDDGNTIPLLHTGDEESSQYSIEDERFRPYFTIGLAYDGTNYYVLLDTLDFEFPFLRTDSGQYLYQNRLGNYLPLSPVEVWGFENNYDFGSGRGNIWAHSFPLLKRSLLTGVGADCYCLVYPHYDYARTYSNGPVDNILLIVDKPHNMYLHAGICTGCVSLVAMLTLYLGYVVQSIRIFRKRDFGNDFLLYAGAGIFLGITAFIV
ncbi:MAG: O-antigen ligase family protein, partial [Firmicutes bacterium]|nr:O-antigen ligase family protein [Bacillota bacterium]